MALFAACFASSSLITSEHSSNLLTPTVHKPVALKDSTHQFKSSSIIGQLRKRATTFFSAFVPPLFAVKKNILTLCQPLHIDTQALSDAHTCETEPINLLLMHETFRPIAKNIQETFKLVSELLKKTGSDKAAQQWKAVLAYLTQLGENHKILAGFPIEVILENNTLMHTLQLKNYLMAHNRDCIKAVLRSLSLESKPVISQQEILGLISDLPNECFLDLVDSDCGDVELSKLIDSFKLALSPGFAQAEAPSLALKLEQQKICLTQLNASIQKTPDALAIENSENNLQNIQFCMQADRQIQIYQNLLVEGTHLIARGLNKEFFPKLSFLEFEQQLLVNFLHAIKLCAQRSYFILLTRLALSLLSTHERGSSVFSLTQSNVTQYLLKEMQDFLVGIILRRTRLAPNDYLPRWRRCKPSLETPNVNQVSNAELLAAGDKEYANIEKFREDLIHLFKQAAETIRIATQDKPRSQVQPPTGQTNFQTEMLNATSSAQFLSIKELPLNTALITPLCRLLIKLDSTVERLNALCETSKLLKTHLNKKTFKTTPKKPLPTKIPTWLLNKSKQSLNSEPEFLKKSPRSPQFSFSSAA